MTWIGCHQFEWNAPRCKCINKKHGRVYLGQKAGELGGGYVFCCYFVVVFFDIFVVVFLLFLLLFFVVVIFCFHHFKGKNSPQKYVGKYLKKQTSIFNCTTLNKTIRSVTTFFFVPPQPRS